MIKSLHTKNKLKIKNENDDFINPIIYIPFKLFDIVHYFSLQLPKSQGYRISVFGGNGEN